MGHAVTETTYRKLLEAARCKSMEHGTPQAVCLSQQMYEELIERAFPMGNIHPLNVADHVETMSRLQQTQAERDSLKMRLQENMGIMKDIVGQATRDPMKLIAFNSPVLQLATMAIFQFNNPDAEPDGRSKTIFRGMVEDQRV